MLNVRFFDTRALVRAFSRRGWLLACCLLVSTASKTVLAGHYSDGLSAYLKGDYEAAKSFWLKGAKAKNARSMFNLGLLHERRQITGASEDKALSWYRLAADNGYAAADYHLALYLESTGGSQSEIDTLLERARQNGYEPAMAQSSKAGSPIAGTSSDTRALARKGLGYRTERWLNGRRAESWTIQMLAFNDESKVQAFIDTHGLKNQAAYYSERSSGETLYKLVYGVYDSKDKADFARQNLSNELKQHGPWLRTIASVQTAIKDQ